MKTARTARRKCFNLDIWNKNQRIEKRSKKSKGQELSTIYAWRPPRSSAFEQRLYDQTSSLSLRRHLWNWLLWIEQWVMNQKNYRPETTFKNKNMPQTNQKNSRKIEVFEWLIFGRYEDAHCLSSENSSLTYDYFSRKSIVTTVPVNSSILLILLSHMQKL